MIEATQKKHEVYWCEKENVPIVVNSLCNEQSLLQKTDYYLCKDCRPVFLEEKHLLKIVCEEFDESIYASSVWAAPGFYYIDGKGKRLSLNSKLKDYEYIDELRKEVLSFLPTSKMLKKETEIFDTFVRLNKSYLSELIYSEKEDCEGYASGADPFIRREVVRYPGRTAFVSFSGGKDSIVVSHLVRKALNSQEVPHIFGDTTLEFPNTYQFLKDFQSAHQSTPFLIEKNEDSNFFDMCEKIGPPSRVKSWCCSIFKTGPMGTTLSAMDIDLLTFYGVRRHESTSRSKYERVTQSPKLKKQIVASPVIDWLDIDIWLYIFTEKLGFNDAYRKGFSRVGCWCCPNNSDWSDVLVSIYFEEHYKKWNKFLVDFAYRVGKLDAEVYVRDGKWKARQGGAGLDSSNTKINAKDCIAKEETAKTYQLPRPVDDDLFELFKPFGEINSVIGRSVLGEKYILNRKKEPIFKIIAKKGELSFRVVLLMTDSKQLNEQYTKDLGRYFWNYIDNQVRKFQSCINCKACDGICPVSAISVENNSYHIDERLCTRCLKCINHFSSGCLIASAMGTKD